MNTTLAPGNSAEPIAIVGMACRFPGAENLQAFWDLLCQGREAIQPLPAARRTPGGEAPLGGYLEEIAHFDAGFFGISAREADAMDPQQRLLLSLSWEVLEDAGIVPSSTQGRAVGVFIGLSSADYYQTQLCAPDQVDMYTITGAAASVCANRLSFFYDWHGPSLVIDTACSSSLSALHLACESLYRAESELALVGGANLLLSPLIQQGFAEAMALSPDGHCRPFAAEAQGIVRAEGAGLVCLMPLSRAQIEGHRIYAVIQGSAMGQDGLTNGLSAPSPAGQRDVLARAYARSGVPPERVSFIEAHGTGTPLGDPIEAKALSEIVGKGRSLNPEQLSEPCRLGSVKSNLGHLEAAAGMAGLIKASLALYFRWLPASLHTEYPNPRIPFAKWGLKLQQTADALPEQAFAGVSAFGFGGTNVHVVLSNLEALTGLAPLALNQSENHPSQAFLVPLSARTPASLQSWRQRLLEMLERQNALDPEQHGQLNRLAYTLARRREFLPCRQSLVAYDGQDFLSALKALPSPQKPAKSRPRLAFLFSGMGSQEIGMGRQLLHSEAFCSRLRELDSVLQPLIQHSLFELLEQEPEDPALVQPLIFALQLALVAQWRAWGIEPEAVLGSSMGEISAAVVAGALELEQAAELLCRRIALLKTRIGSGRMAVVGLGPEALQRYLEDQPVWIAAVNAPELCVIAGQGQALDQLLARWRSQPETRELFVREIKGASAPSHTPLLEGLKAPLLASLEHLNPQAAQLPFWSTVSGCQLSGQELDADYWWQNLSQPVQLVKTIQDMLKGQSWTLLEISPHPLLASGLAQLSGPQGESLEALGSLRKDSSDLSPMLRSLGRLFELGFEVNWQALYPELQQHAQFSLPPYAFEKHLHWLPAPADEAVGDAARQSYQLRLQPGSKAPQSGLADQSPEANSAQRLSLEDLRALPAAERQRPLAQALQRIVADSLRLEAKALELDQPLKHLGIGSLLGMELYQRLKKEWGVALALSDVLKGPSLNQLSQLILQQLEQQPSQATPLSQRPASLPLSFAQQRFWFFEQMQPQALTYHIPGVLELKGKLDSERLQQALQGLVERHEILRTLYQSDQQGQPFQQVLEPQDPRARLQFSQFEWREDFSELAGLALRPFALDQLPPFRVSLLSDSDKRHRLLIDLHHLVADGFSFKILFHDLKALYLGQSLEPAPQYADFALSQRAQAQAGAFETDLDYWRRRLQGAPELLPLPTDFARSAQQDSQGRRYRFEVPAEQVSALEALGREQGVSLYTLLLGAYLNLLQRLSQSQDLVIGTPVLGRSDSRWNQGVGPYLNMLPLRSECNPGDLHQSFWQALQAEILAGFDHQEVPFEQIVEALRPQRELAWHPLYQYVFALHAPLEAEEIGELEVSLLDLDLGISRFDLALTLHPSETGLQGSVEYRSSLFRPETIAALVAGFLNLLAQLPAAAAKPLASLPLSLEPLQPRLVGPQQALPQWRLAERILSWAQQPELLAILSEQTSLSYAELCAQAQSLAAWLVRQQAERVAIALPRSPQLIIAWLGALLAGACYIPLDPEHPPARLQQLLADAQPQALIAPAVLLEQLEVFCQTLAAERLRELQPADYLPLKAEAIYQIYTSGSSGQPKGVRISEASLLNLISWHQQAYQLQQAEHVSLLANPAFDAAAWEVWPALAAGATLCLPPASLQEPEQLKHWLARRQIAVAFVPTPLLERLLDGPWPQTALRALLTGGDRLQRRPDQLPCTLFNHYGPTENTVVTTVAQVQPSAALEPIQTGQQELPAIGWPLPNMQLYLLDAQGQMLPPGLAGELWIGGQGLALDYWRQPELSRQAFVSSPAGRLYRSGDRVALRPDGLHFEGRQDQQLKLRGVRLEAAEIEALLCQHPQVHSAAVLLYQQALWAFVTATETKQQALRVWLSQRLPEVMVPSRIVVLDQLPLTERGKLDRQALAGLAQQLPLPEQVFEAESATLGQLAEIWHRLLPGVELSPEADFFALGGHSLLALDLRHQIQQQLGLELPLIELFRLRTLRALADYLSHQAPLAAWPALISQPEQAYQPFELNEVQQAYWIGRSGGLELGAVSAHAYLELEFASLDLKHLAKALDQLITLHPMLRCVIDKDARQRILKEVPPYQIEIQDLRALTAAERERRLLETRQNLSHEVRPAEIWPLFGIQASLLPGQLRLHLSIDALIADASSLLLLGQQLEQLYLEPELRLPEPEISFRDVLQYEQQLKSSARYARDRDYWLKALPDLPPAPALPLRQAVTEQKKPQSNPAQPHFKRISASLPAASWQQLKQRAAQLGITPSGLLLSAFGSVLAAWQDYQPLTLNLTTFARLPIHPQIQSVVGDFTRLSLLAFEPQPENFAAQSLALQARLLEDLDHPLFSAIELMRALRAERGPEASRMPVVFTSLLGAEAQQPLAAIGAEVVFSRTQTPQVWLDHQVAELEGELVYHWDYPEGIFLAGFAQALFTAYQRLLDWLLEQSDWQQPLPAVADLAQGPDSPASEPQLLHQALIAQAYATPDAPALLSPGGNLSYAELLSRAFELAHELGPQPADQPLAIWLEPGWQQLVAVLAVLLSGGAYLPLNPAWPPARLESLLRRAQPAAVLTSPERLPLLEPLFAGRLLAPEARAAELPESAVLPERAQVEALLSRVRPAALAYIIFTSGSSGEPKGVMIEHQAAWNTVADVNQRLQVQAHDRVFGLSELSFDLSVYDIFGPLALGASLVYPEAALAREPAHWLELCRQHRVSIWNSVPALMAMLTAYAQTDPERSLPELRAVMLSGDWIPLELPDAIRQSLQPETRIYSLGGATEAAIWSIWYEIQAVDPSWKSIPYGWSLAQQGWQVLDSRRQPCPIWAAGDLYISGKGLARGYFQDPAQTAERFIRHPQTGERLYHTGDRGRRRQDGCLEFLGRQDLQVKVQGYRIELAEIEGVLQSHPLVEAAVVLALGPIQGPRYLVGCLQARQGLSEPELVAWLGARLPGYMLPVRWLWLEQWPLNATGKVSRQALSELASQPSVAKASPLAQLLAEQPDPWLTPLQALLRTELNLPTLDPDQDLLSLGVNSIDLVRLGNQLEQRYGVTPGMGELFGLRNLRALANWYSRQPQADRVLFLDAAPEPQSLARVSLPLPPEQAALPFQAWRSQREFAQQALSQEQLSQLLLALSQEAPKQAKRLYGSAGSSYTVRAYLQLRPEAVRGLAAGCYLYQEADHSLSLIQSGDQWPEDLHLPVSQAMAAASRFSIYLVADLGLISPKYGSDSRDYCLLETGAMAQLLRQQAAASQLALCAIGRVNPQRVAELLQLGPQQELLHTLLGGLPLLAEELEEWII